MKKNLLSSNLHRLLDIHGNMSVSELAKLTNIPQPTLHHILSGITKKPQKKSLEALSNFFSISIKQLIGEESLPTIIPPKIKHNLEIYSVPIIQWDTLKSWPNAEKNCNLGEILLNFPVSDYSFSLILEETTFEPLFYKNTLLIFDAGKTPQERDFVIAYIAKSNSILFNRFFMDNNEYYVKQDLDDGNAKLIRLYKDSDKIIGTLIEARIRY